MGVCRLDAEEMVDESDEDVDSMVATGGEVAGM